MQLSEQQKHAISQGEVIHLTEPDTGIPCVMLRADVFEKAVGNIEKNASQRAADDFEIPPGIQRSKEAFWRALPGLLAKRRLRGKFVGYHGDEQIGIANDDRDIVREALRRGIARNMYYIGTIAPCDPEPEEIDRSFVEFEDEEFNENEPPDNF